MRLGPCLGIMYCTDLSLYLAGSTIEIELGPLPIGDDDKSRFAINAAAWSP